MYYITTIAILSICCCENALRNKFIKSTDVIVHIIFQQILNDLLLNEKLKRIFMDDRPLSGILLTYCDIKWKEQSIVSFNFLTEVKINSGFLCK